MTMTATTATTATRPNSPPTLPILQMLSSGETVYGIAPDGSPYRVDRRSSWMVRCPDSSIQLDGLPLVRTADEAAWMAQCLCRLLGIPLDFGAALDPAQRDLIQTEARKYLQARGLIP